MPIVAPSLLSANFLHLQSEADMLNKSQADWFHLDVMDGNFVPNISFGPMVVKFFRQSTTKFLDVHLMVNNPENIVEAFKQAGADSLTVHLEACHNLHRNVTQIKNLGMKVGVAINPHTPVFLLYDVLGDLDLVCIMSVNPGYSGQKFIEHSFDKVKTLRNYINEKKYSTKIEVDGGVTLENAKSILYAGADVLVAGSTIFNSSNPSEVISELKLM